MVSFCSVITRQALFLAYYLTKFNNFSVPPIYFLYFKKTNFERMADGMGELCHIANNSALLGNICDFMFHLLMKIIILFCVLIFLIKAAYQ
jgi:hypothetical protein